MNAAKFKDNLVTVLKISFDKNKSMHVRHEKSEQITFAHSTRNASGKLSWKAFLNQKN